MYKVLKYVIIFLLDDNFLSFLHARTLQARRTAASCTQGAISLPPAYLCARPHTRANSANSGNNGNSGDTAISGDNGNSGTNFEQLTKDVLNLENYIYSRRII